jgi:hypothetical protein
MKFRFFSSPLILIILCSAMAYGQNQYVLPQLTPQSPNTASLGKYGEIPVSLSNGLANISVPLLNLKVGSFNVPVELTYHNNGYKPDELASWVGMGWDIQAGGMISLEQRGNYDFDESGNGMFTTAPGTNPNSVAALNKYLANQMSQTELNAWQESVIRGDVDAEYDLYHYSFFGHTGNFYFDGNQNIVITPKSDLKITKTGNGFTIMDEKGIEYDFSYSESSTLGPPDGQATSNRKSFHTAASFLLGRVITAENRTITFGYSSYPMTYNRTSWSVGRTAAQPNTSCQGNSMASSLMIYTLDNWLLQQISFDEGTVFFDLSTDMRKDFQTINTSASQPVNTSINVPYLSGIRLVDKLNKVRDAYSFSCQNDGSSRLMLNSVTRSNGQAPAEKWSFDYYTGNGNGAYFDVSKDHWGYSNNRSLGADGIAIPLADYDKVTNGVWTSGDNFYVDRTANFSYAITGMLHHITYPTGGQTEFNYEQNQINFLNPTDLTNNPFLSSNPLQYGTTQDLVAETTDNNAVVTGSFTLATAQTISVIASRDYDPNNFVVSQVYLNKSDNPNAVPDILDNEIVNGWTAGSNQYSFQKSIELDAGTYTYTLYRNTNQDAPDPSAGHAALTIAAFVPNANIIYPLGGGRISSIVSSDGLGNTITKKYVYDDASDKVIFWNIPNYVTKNQVNTNLTGSEGNVTFGCRPCNPAYIAHDESVVPFTGNSIQYLNVTEYTDENGANGKTDYTFSQDVDYTGVNQVPHIPRWVTTWRGGLPLDKKVYKNDGSNYVLVSEETSNYEAITPSYITGMMVEYSVYCPDNDPGDRQYAMGQEQFINETFHQLSSGQTFYDNSGNIASSKSNAYLSQAHTLPTSISQTNSRGEPVRQQIYYSMDYTVSSAADNISLGIKNLQSHNVLVPIENLSIKTINGTDYVTGGLLITYKTSSIEPDVVYRLKVVTPIPLSTFTLSSIASGGNFVMDSHYEDRAEFNAYDANNNILQNRYADNSYSSYLWDYKALHLVCEVKNAAQQDIAYTSFEADGVGNWSGITAANVDATKGMTGSHCYNLNASITRSGLTAATTYIVSYWTQNASSLSIAGTISGYPVKGKTIGSWTLYTHKVTGQTTITVGGGGVIDELRLYPAAAEMITYTYDPLVGMTTQTDIGNRISYYEYDDLQRLMRIRDQDHNIVKAYEYHFYQPKFYNDDKSATFTRNNCASGSTPGTYIYDVPANTYTSTISKDDANAQAQNDINTNGQAAANANTSCTFVNDARSGTFTRQACDPGSVAGSYTYLVAAGTYRSTISKDDANNKAQSDVNANGQNAANTLGTCTFFSVSKQGTFTRQGCQGTSHPGTVTYVVPAHTYSSTISQLDADTKAQNDVNANGQNYANSVGACICQGCAGEGLKCMSDGTCEMGVKVYTGSVYDPSLGQYVCTFHYEFSDGSWSADSNETNPDPCAI